LAIIPVKKRARLFKPIGDYSRQKTSETFPTVWRLFPIKTSAAFQADWRLFPTK
jgi:hypothetical protein